MNKTIENDSVHENPAQKELALSLDLNKREAGITADEKNVFDNTSEIISTVDEAKKENRRIVGLLICICLFSICGGCRLRYFSGSISLGLRFHWFIYPCLYCQYTCHDCADVFNWQILEQKNAD